MNDLVYSIRAVFCDYLQMQECKYYNIPEYQRGYKWTKDEVKTLLDDLQKFERSGKKSYCLQNITIAKGEDGKMNVIDGQQRLTTLYIIISYLKSVKKVLDGFKFDPDIIRYGVRESTATYLKKCVATGDIWNKGIINPDDAEHKDEYYIRVVAKAVDEWFKTSINGNTNNIEAYTLLNKVELIVNNLVTTNEEQLFTGLNGGKVDLDGADLVRAELITRSAQERFGKHIELAEGDSKRINEFRVRIGMELDQINQWWDDKYKQEFFRQMLGPNSSDRRSHIFDYVQHPIDLLYLLYYECDRNENEQLDFRFFEYGRDTNNIRFDHDHWELYESLINMHHTLQDWYEDSDIYHWLGYLFFCFKGRSVNFKNICGSVNFKNIYRKWGQWETWLAGLTEDERNMQIQTRSEFVNYLQDLSRGLLLNKFKAEKDDNNVDTDTGTELLNAIADLKETDWYNGDTIRLQAVLVLMDILICTDRYEYREDDKIKDKKRLFEQRLLPSYFRMNSENKEHVRSCTPNDAEGGKEKSKKKWIDHINNLYRDEKEDTAEDNLKKRLLDCIGQMQNEDEELSDAKILEINSLLNQHAQNSIGNLLLLDEHVNKSYGNRPFNEKVQRIIREYMQQKNYIRPYTLLVFLSKFDDDDSTWRWTKKDIENNANNISKQVSNFLSIN